ncbi:MAG: hypothetical protein LBV60_09315 [Streptomyces sp.]|jgi:hypothetical protein|nr:hypothetical protein [Streptomyces sp.]
MSPASANGAPPSRALVGCAIAGPATGGIGCGPLAGIGAGLGAAGGFIVGIPLGIGIWQGWRK